MLHWAGERDWIRPTGRNEWSHSLDLLEHPKLPALCLLSCSSFSLPSCFLPLSPSPAVDLPYVPDHFRQTDR